MARKRFSDEDVIRLLRQIADDYDHPDNGFALIGIKRSGIFPNRDIGFL